jgi:hypothetical protein
VGQSHERAWTNINTMIWSLFSWSEWPTRFSYPSKPWWTLHGIICGRTCGHGELSAHTGRQISGTFLLRFSNMLGEGRWRGVIWILEAAATRYQKQTSASGLFTLVTPEGSIISRLNLCVVVQQYFSLLPFIRWATLRIWYHRQLLRTFPLISSIA